MKLMNEDYSYNYTKFYGKTGGVFKIIGSRSEKINSRIENTIDAFITECGEYIEIKRDVILEQVKKGKMLPVIESIITFEAPVTKKIKTTKKSKN